MLNFIKPRLPRPSFRFFLFVLFGLAILVLLAEGGYYFWIQKGAVRQQTENPVIAKEEGVFTYIKQPDGIIEKMILGKIEKKDGNLMTIKTDNNKTAQVLFTGESPQITRVNFKSNVAEFKIGTIADLLIGDKVMVGEIYSEEGGQISAKFLEAIRETNEPKL